MRKILVALTTLIISIIGILPASATANDFYFEDAQFDYYLSKAEDGSSKMKVKEILTAVFPDTNQNHGITRVIPYTNQNGKNLTMKSSTHLDLSVTRNGQPEPVAKIENQSNYGSFIVYVGDANSYVHGKQVYVLEYEFENVITEFDGYQELYWDTNGTGWSQKFNSLTANLHFANDIKIPSTDNTWCYVGRHGSNNQSRCKINNISDGLSFKTENLKSSENLTMAVKFPAGTFTIIHHESYLLLIILAILSVISIALITYLVTAYNKYARNDKRYYKDLLTPAQYIPLKGFTAAELGTVYLGSTRNLQVANLLELAVSHKVELIQTDKKKWSIRIKDANNLTSDQLQTLQIFAGSKKQFTIDEEIPIEKYSSYSSTRHSLITAFPINLKSSLVKKGLFVEKTHSGLPTFFLVLYVIALIGGFYGLITLLDYNYATLIGEDIFWAATPIIAIATLITSLFLIKQITKYSKYTRTGLDASNYAAGLKEYIGLAEKDRLTFNQSTDGAPKDTEGRVKLYERLLPYASLFGMEKSWLKQLQVYYDENPRLTPSWYIGTTMFNTRDFTSAISSMSSSLATMSSSSSSSGSGGGGFSGGGGGGGGGGGW
ncbi:DUF2207 domain-containing protein [Candidatus Saccharibacteria bacterium]|nr:DUF2207 domain-containing protein [Candidatus Saccharibacteria bacterium]